jgi:hypothetical protein
VKARWSTRRCPRIGKTLFYTTNAGDIERRHIWKVPTAEGRRSR